MKSPFGAVADCLTLVDRAPRAVSWLDHWAPPANQPEPLHHILAADPPAGPPLSPDQLPDIGHMRDALEQALAALGQQWADLTDAQKQQLVDQIRQAADHGHVTDLATLTVGTAATTAALTAAMAAIAVVASRQLVTEAAEQGIDVPAVHLPISTFEPIANVVATLLGDELRITAARAALRTGPDAAPADIAQAARVALDQLSTAGPDRELGGALHGSMNTARVATLRAAPVGAIYASEVNDRNTCAPCRAVDGRWLGNTDDLAQALALYPAGAYGGYIDCLGGIRCRGTIVGVWRPKQAGPGDRLAKYNPAEPRRSDGKWGTGLGEVIAEAAIKLAGGTLTVQARHDSDDGHLNLSDGDGHSITLDDREQHRLSGALGSDEPFEYGKRYHGHRTEILWKVSDGHTLSIADPDEPFDDFDARPGMRLTDKQVQDVEDTMARLAQARRLDTGNGPLDAWVTQDDHIGLRMSDEDGQPTEVVISDKDWTKISGALNTVIEGFDEAAIPSHAPDDYEPPEVHSVIVKTSAGQVEVEWHGPRNATGYSARANFTIVPLYSAPWSVAVNGDHMSDVLSRFGWLEDAAGMR